MPRLLTAVLLFVMSSAALAQEVDDEGRQVKYKSRTEIDFDAVDVSGELVKPAGQVGFERRKADFNPLITLRPDFNAEMKQSLNEIQ